MSICKVFFLSLKTSNVRLNLIGSINLELWTQFRLETLLEGECSLYNFICNQFSFFVSVLLHKNSLTKQQFLKSLTL